MLVPISREPTRLRRGVWVQMMAEDATPALLAAGQPRAVAERLTAGRDYRILMPGCQQTFIKYPLELLRKPC